MSPACLIGIARPRTITHRHARHPVGPRAFTPHPPKFSSLYTSSTSSAQRCCELDSYVRSLSFVWTRSTAGPARVEGGPGSGDNERSMWGQCLTAIPDPNHLAGWLAGLLLIDLPCQARVAPLAGRLYKPRARPSPSQGTRTFDQSPESVAIQAQPPDQPLIRHPLPTRARDTQISLERDEVLHSCSSVYPLFRSLPRRLQKIVIKMSMATEKTRSKAMALVAKADGMRRARARVSSMGVTGDGKDQLEVVGDGIDSVCLVQCLRKKIGHADIVKVEEVKPEKKEEKKPEEKKPEPLPYWWYYHYHPAPPCCGQWTIEFARSDLVKANASRTRFPNYSSVADTSPSPGQAMKQKMVIKVSMPCERRRARAMTLAARADGVISMAITGDAKDKLEVVGDGVDPVRLVGSLRRKVGPAEILHVEEVKEKKPEEKKPEEKKPGNPKPPQPMVVYPPPPQSCPGGGYYYYPHHPPPRMVVCEEPNTCPIM
ncbi:hypothetical protein HU200_032200 [Digitaria exilis]|uniref:HMA domain-containing protein n=1 Tax=Digitaria exilis TaxID=1010633 RepID=A0A835BX80_9POAL|nr:hypothetical protein HU200_032200 [Digitaria exilis]